MNEKVAKLKNIYTIEDSTIIIKRELTELDIFVKDFLQVLKNHADYLICSGYVSIASGRTRGTEDVDILVQALDEKAFEKLFDDFCQNGFWCYQGDTAKEVYQYIKDLVSIRFARIDEIFPNIEFIPINQNKRIKFFEFNNPQKMRVKDFEFKVPPIEFEILYKEIILGSDKDLADARHLRAIFSDLIKKEKFKKFRDIIQNNDE